MAATSTLAPGLARKLKKVLETRTDSPEVLASLGTLSTFYTENTPQARRNLQATIEKRGLSINDEFLRASEAAQKALDAVEMEVAGLAESCDRIAKSLSSCNAVTGEIVMTTEKLKLDFENTTHRQRIVSSFLHNYQLSPEEISALREEELNDNFFKALSRVHEIHANCKFLLRTHHQRAGIELMDMMAVYQEGAYERLCRWVQAECRSLSDNDHPEVSELLRMAAKCLKERPVLFKYCAEEVANTRHNALFRRFISALTRGGPGGMPRPIEVHAHDPLRYVGDMLAWLHQALASERELAACLFSNDGGSEQSETYMGFVLDRIFEGVCRPFKVRVEQVLQSQPGLLLAYKLCNLLGFYVQTIRDIVGAEGALSVAVNELREAAERSFFDMLKSRGDKMLRYPPPIGAADLSAPAAVIEGVNLLIELLQTHNNSMMLPGDFEPVISALVDPIIEMCERAAEKKMKVKLKRWDGKALRKIFMMNCLSAIEEALRGYEEAAGSYLKRIEKSIEEHMKEIVDGQVACILEACGLNSSGDGDGDDDVEEKLVKLVSEGGVAEFEEIECTTLRNEASVRVGKCLAHSYQLNHSHPHQRVLTLLGISSSSSSSSSSS